MNVLLILADDLGYGDLGAFGHAAVRTPALDSLAAQGLRLTQHYSASAVCAPARAGLLTGRYPHRTGAIDTLEGRGLDRLSLRERTLADRFKAAGYATGLFGKWHLGALDRRYHPNARGFQEFAGFRGGWQDYWDWRLDRNGSYQSGDGRYLTDVITEEAAGFIRRHGSEPFFLHVTFNAPHFPLQVPEEELAPFQTGEYTDAVARIYAMNARMDRGVGRLLETLDAEGLREDTLVLFTSDNGPQFGGQGEQDSSRYNGHFNGCKGNVYEGGIRVPAIVRWPAGLPGRGCVDGTLHFTDWVPTLLAAAGLPADDGLPLDGINALPRLRGETSQVEPQRFWQWNRYAPVATCNAAMRDGPWKLLRPVLPEAMRVTPADLEMDRRLKYQPDTIPDISRDPEPERTLSDPPAPLLFNLDSDPYELQNLAAQQPERLGRMGAELDRWFSEVETERRASLAR